MRSEPEAWSWPSVLAPNSTLTSNFLVHTFFERLARAEADDATLRDLDGGAGLRVARGAGLALRGLERAEADERDRLSLLERLGDPFEEGIHGGLRVRLGEAGILREFGDEMLFVHDASGSE